MEITELSQLDLSKTYSLQYQMIDGRYVNYRPLTIEDSLESTSIVGFEIALSKMFG